MKSLFTILLLSLFFQNVIFAQVDHWETAIFNDDVWKYHIGTVAPPSQWNEISFDDTNWASGQGSIGYGDNDDLTLITPTPSVFLRKQINVSDPDDIIRGILHADYDDGFVAYLNGTEIARANLDGTPPDYDADANDYHEAQMYQNGLPEIFSINSSLLEDLLQEGNNVLSIQVHNFNGANSSDLTANFFLSFGIQDESVYFDIPPSWFYTNEISSTLPILRINTGGQYIPDEPAVQGQLQIIWNEDGSLNHSEANNYHFTGNINVERRGQSSLLLFPKNGFSIETQDSQWQDMDTSFLNFPKEEDWVLHGPYSDKTLMRNVLTMELAKKLGQYSSRTRFVELFLEDSYEGIYVLMEKIKRDNDRVDLAKLQEEDLEGDELTGGYIFKIDKGDYDWESDFNILNTWGEKLKFSFVYPKRSKIQPAQGQYLQSVVDSFEYALIGQNFHYGGKRYDEFIDMPSFVDHFIIQELSKNVDAYRISSYYHKKKITNGGKIHAGPIWDFNLAWGNADYCEAWTTTGWVYNAELCQSPNPFWWSRMYEDEIFENMVKCRWQEIRSTFLSQDSLNEMIDQYVETLNPALERNFTKWPVLNQYVWPNPQVSGSYSGEIEYIKSFIDGRIQWMDFYLLEDCTVSSKNIFQIEDELQVFPNPVQNKATIKINTANEGTYAIQILDASGQQIDQIYSGHLSKGDHFLNWDSTSIPSGVYLVKVISKGQVYFEKIIISK